MQGWILLILGKICKGDFILTPDILSKLIIKQLWLIQ